MATKKFKILMVDDEKNERDLFTNAVKKASKKIELITLDNGNSLTDYLNRKTPLPDVLFLDIYMPDKSGLDCLAEIRNTELLKDLPVAMCSVSVRDMGISMNTGADIYVRKPNRKKDLTELIDYVSNIDWSKKKSGVSKIRGLMTVNGYGLLKSMWSNQVIAS